MKRRFLAVALALLMVMSILPLHTLAVPTAQTSTNLLTNGDFRTLLEAPPTTWTNLPGYGWIVYRDNIPAFSLEMVEDEGRNTQVVNIPHLGSTFWHIQLHQRARLSVGTTYRLSVTARSNETRNITVEIGALGVPSGGGTQVVTLGTEYTTWVHEFTPVAAPTHADGANFMLHLGVPAANVPAVPNQVFLREVSLVVIDGEEPGVDKAALIGAITTAQARVEASYTQESWAAMQSALAAAIAVRDNEEATQIQVDEARVDLVNATNALDRIIMVGNRQPAPDFARNPNFKLVWEDDFTAPELDETVWHVQTGTGGHYNLSGWGNDELQYYRRENVSIRNNMLMIQARRENYGGMQFTSARIRTGGEMPASGADAPADGFTGISTMFGRIEASIALPVGTGMWPAFWMLPEDSLYGGWPMGGEIDIMEARGRQPSLVTGALHWGTSPSSSWRSGNHALVDRTIYDFNIYAVEWEPSQIRWYVNDINYFTINMTDSNTWWSREPSFPNTSAAANFTRPAPFDQPFHMLLNLAVGGNFDGGQAPPADFQSGEMWVDFVRIYEWDGPEFAPVPGATADVHPTDNTLKSTLRDGNIIWNGTFDRGVNRLGFWNIVRNNDAAATFYVADDATQHPNRPRRLEVSGISESATVSDVQLIQTRIPMHNETYRLDFDAMASVGRNIVFEVADMGGNVVYSAPISLTTQLQNRVHEFALTGIENGAEMQVRFNFGGNTANVTMDNVSLRRLTFLSVDYTGVNVFPLWNGDFFAGISGWGTAGEISYPFTVQDGVFTATINALGASPWYNQLESPVMSIERGHEFVVEFDAWAQNPREIQVVVEPPPWGTRQLDEVVSLTNERQTFRMPAFMPAGTGGGSQDLQLKFLMGNVPPTSATGRVYISNVRVFIQQDQFRQIPTFMVLPVEGPRAPGMDMEFRYNAAFDPIFNAVEKTVRIGAWGNFVTIPTIIDDKNGNLVIPGQYITRGGNLSIEITADGFAPLVMAQAVTDNNLLRNGIFSVPVTAAGNGWTRAASDGGNVAQGTAANLQRFRAANVAALGTAPHSTMLGQSVYLEAGVEYVLSLAARAGNNAGRRDVSVQVGGNPATGDLGINTFVVPIESITAAEPTTWSTTITVEESGPVTIYLLLGRHDTGRQPTGANIDMWLSEIRLAPAVAVPPEVPGRRPLPPNVGADPDMWNLTWSDNFDGADLDETRWHVQTGTGAQYGIVGWGNAELQYYRRQNVSVRDGNLVIRGQREATPIGGRNFTSARIRTGGERASGTHDPFDGEFQGFSQAYGRFEASIALPDIPGMWPAFWMLPQNSLYGGWPMGGEIDIMEAMGRLPGEASSAIHFGGPWPGVHQYRMAIYHFEDGSFPDRNITDFNLYAVEWEPGQIRWYINGDLYHTRNSEEWFSRGNNTSAPFSSPAPFDQPFHILLNMAMGGNFDPGAVIPADFDYAEMLVEFVRVYELVGRDFIRPGEGGEEEKDEYPEGSKTPDVTGNFTRGNDFANVRGPFNQAIDGAPVDHDSWIVTFNGGGAGGTVTGISVGDDEMLHIAIGAGGGQPWAVQMMQFVPLAHGRHYQFTFDARAQAPRNIAANIGAGGEDGNWSTYAGHSFALATETRTFSYQFTMRDPSHARARVEFNMGGNASDVWIGNVRIEEISYLTFEEPVKTPIGTGATMNHLWNGTFDQGQNFMGFWNPIIADTASAMFEVPDCVSWHPPHWPLQASAPFRPRQLHVTEIVSVVPEDVMMTQTLIPMFRDTYRIEFLGRAEAVRNIGFRVADMEGNVFHTGTIGLDTDFVLRTHEFTLTQPNPDNRYMQIQFLFGGNQADVIMDNVFLRRLTSGDDAVPALSFSNLIVGNRQLTVTLDTAVTGLSINDFTVTGARLLQVDTSSAPVYTLLITDITSETVRVALEREGFAVSPTYREVTIAEPWVTVPVWSGNFPSVGGWWVAGNSIVNSKTVNTSSGIPTIGIGTPRYPLPATPEARAMFDFDLLTIPGSQLHVTAERRVNNAQINSIDVRSDISTGIKASVNNNSRTNLIGANTVGSIVTETFPGPAFDGAFRVGFRRNPLVNEVDIDFLTIETGNAADGRFNWRNIFVTYPAIETPASENITGVELTGRGKHVYNVGEPLDLTGMTITVTYADDSTREVPVTANMVVNFSTAVTRASRTITIVYPNVAYMGRPWPVDTTITVNGLAPVTANRAFPQADVNRLAVDLLRPTGVSQEQMNANVIEKFRQMIDSENFMIDPDPATVNDPMAFRMVLEHFTSGVAGDRRITVSESMGYGMYILALMAGADEYVGIDVKAYFDGMLRSIMHFPTTQGGNPPTGYHRLMAWELISDSRWKTVPGANWRHTAGSASTATDGSMDMAYALLLASEQWEYSNCGMRYIDHARILISEIWRTEVNKTTFQLTRGNWDRNNFSNTRPSDHMMAHLHAFAEVDQAVWRVGYTGAGQATGTFGNVNATVVARHPQFDQTVPRWQLVIDTKYRIAQDIISNESAETGLLPDFGLLQNDAGSNTAADARWRPVPGRALESIFDGHYHWNACRVPWRQGLDVILFGQSPVSDMTVRFLNERQFEWAGGNFDNIVGRDMSGRPNLAEDRILGVTTAGSAFSSSAIVPAFIYGPQEWVNDGWRYVTELPWEGNAYGDYITMLAMIAASGNEWSPILSQLIPPTEFNGTNPARLVDLLETEDVVLQTSSNLGIFTQHSPFVVPAGRTLYIETTLNVQRGAELVIEGTVVVLPGGRINNQGNNTSGGAITIEDGGRLVNDGHVENVSNSNVFNYGTIINNGRFEVRARTVFIDEGVVDGTTPLSIHRDAVRQR